MSPRVGGDRIFLGFTEAGVSSKVMASVSQVSLLFLEGLIKNHVTHT